MQRLFFFYILWVAISIVHADLPTTLPACAVVTEDVLQQGLPINLDSFFVKQNISYMNTATLGPMPRSAVRCAMNVWEELEQDPLDLYPWGSGQELDQVRAKAAALLSCDVDEIVLTPSTTVALNMIGEGLVSSGYWSKESPSNVLTTDQEHGGGVAWIQHWQTAGYVQAIEKISIPYGKQASISSVVSAFEHALAAADAVGKSYRVVFCSHVMTTTGLRLPLNEIAKIVHAHGALFVVDGAQALGGINVNLNDVMADVYTVSAHKWLLAPTGSGLLYIRKDTAKSIVTPTYLDGGYNGYSASTGTVPVHTVAGLGYALDFFSGIGGLRKVEIYNMNLCEIAYQRLQVMVDSFLSIDAVHYAGLEIISPRYSSGLSSPILSLNLPPLVLTNSDACFSLRNTYGVIVKQLPDFEGGNNFVINAIRISHHLFNKIADVNKLMCGLSALLSNVNVNVKVNI